MCDCTSSTPCSECFNLYMTRESSALAAMTAPSGDHTQYLNVLSPLCEATILKALCESRKVISFGSQNVVRYRLSGENNT